MTNEMLTPRRRSAPWASATARSVSVLLGALAITLIGLTPSVAPAQGKQRAAEMLTVSFTTATTLSPEFAPRNILVVWVEDSTGTFVKTIGRWAGERYYDLVNWTGKAGYDTDAVTGATRRNHTAAVQVTWDMTDKAGQTKPDGTYRIRLELADRDRPNAASNNLGTFTFAKNGTASVQNTSGGRFSNVNITYSGRPVTYTLAVAAGAGGQIVQPATSPGTHLQNDVVTIQASASAGYAFAGWTGSANVAAAGSALTTVHMLANTSITANFTDLDEQFVVSGTARTVPEGGSAGIAVALTAQPTGTITANLDYASGDLDISGATRAQLQFTTATWNAPQTVTFTAAEDADATNGVASFQLVDAAANLTPVGLTFTEVDDDHVLTLAVDPSEAGTVAPPGATVQEGAPAALVPIVATPAVGWQFVEWTGDLQQVANPQAGSTAVTMGASYSATANFERLRCTLTVSAGTGGSVDAPAEATAVHDYGTTVALVATPDPYKAFDRWISSPDLVASEFAASTTITLTADTIVQATFKDVDVDNDQLPDAWEAGYFTDPAAQDGGGNPDLDLLTNAEEYAIGSDPTKTTLVVTTGWNLLAVPRSPAQGMTHADQLSGLAYSSVWGWDGVRSRYYDVTQATAGEDVLRPLAGYWVLVTAAGWVDLAGTGFPAGDRDLTKGWNLVGPLAGGVFAPPAEVSPIIWGWDGTGYVRAVGLDPTLGAWIYCSGPVTVTLP